MQTVMIFDQMNGELRFAVFPGDLSRFDGVYINSATDDQQNEKKQKELGDLLYDYDTGEDKVVFVTEFPKQAVVEGANVIVCGFMP